MLRKETTQKKPPALVIPAAKAAPQPSAFDAMPDGAYIREAQLVPSPKRPDAVALLPFSAPTLWRKVREGTFCKPYRLSSRVTAWRVGEVRAWMAAQEAQVYDTAAVTAKLAKRIELVQS